MWNRAATHPGTFAANAQDDVIVLAVCFFHHGLGGGLQGWGAYTGDSIMFRHGMLIETGAFESEEVELGSRERSRECDVSHEPSSERGFTKTERAR
jgi:hypothetical protein